MTKELQERPELAVGEPESRTTKSGRRRALAGLVSGILALGIGDLIAIWTGQSSSPYLAVGSAVVDAMPTGLKEFAITTFGSFDKLALFVVMAVVIAALLAVAGMVESRRRPYGTVMFYLFGAIGMAAAWTRADAGVLSPLPTLLGIVAGVLALRTLTTKERGEAVKSSLLARRSFVQLLGIGAAAGGIAFAAGRAFATTARKAVSSRESVTLPEPVERERLQTGTQVDVLEPFQTPNNDFYRIDTALQVPQLSADEWSLRVHGMVDTEITMSFAELLKLPMIERMMTLSCVSNPVGGNLVGNALWLGYPIRELLSKAGVHYDADMVLSKSSDGFTAGTPLDTLTDSDRDAILAVGMNGEPLPMEHGFPVRMVVPGLYGFVSATKWLVDLEVTRFDRKVAYWTTRGWSARGPVKLSSRIEVPRSGGNPVQPGPVVVAGTAWSPHVGIERVELKLDSGPWQPTELAAAPSTDTWRQWRFDWDAKPGSHRLTVRAIDTEGVVQTSSRAAPAPDGATGLHSRTVTVG
ncbi:molybdopterin-dependent oxidoreductase [Saxibacter everestensis]|uniref:Molybdopterin-dependent oxidoreductase n=1 Tax=Saxibacter everestensis TaxID=2909229 RepID=A0ABY8QQ26_9MICO|nr:molybdopterin-dependent oxidoreductase [Brevibacteriaceae bacterium ZFBP1038]